MAWATNGITRHNKSLKNFCYGLGDQREHKKYPKNCVILIYKLGVQAIIKVWKNFYYGLDDQREYKL